MYEERRYTFDWKGFIVKLIVVLLVIFALYKFVPAVKVNTLYDQVFNDNLTTMKDSAKSYYTKDRLPEKVGESKTMTLQEMLNDKMLVNFVDKNGKYCDTFGSYATITKTGEEEYILKTQLACGDQIDYVLETIGCYNVCKDNSCNVDKIEEIAKVTEYQFKKKVTTTKTVKSCAEGYKLNGNTCYKTVNSKYVNAEKVYYEDVTTVVDALVTSGNTNKVYTDERITNSSSDVALIIATPNKVTIPATVVQGNSYTVPTTSNVYANATCKNETTYGSWKLVGNTSSCNSSATVKCTYLGLSASVACDNCSSNYDPVYKKYTRTVSTKNVCTCASGTLSGTQCVSTVTTYDTVNESDSYTCPSDYTLSGRTCSKYVTTYSCPTGFTANASNTSCTKKITVSACPSDYKSEGEGETLKCYKEVKIEGNTYCKDEAATLEDGKCITITKGAFKEYKCADSKMVLLGSKCYSTSTKTLNVITSTKKVNSYKYMWSTQNTIDGWSKTSKTRQVDATESNVEDTNTTDKSTEKANKDSIITDSNKELSERLINVNNNSEKTDVVTIILYVLIGLGLIYLFIMFLFSHRTYREN